MSEPVSIEAAILELDTAVGRMAGGGRRSRQAREVRLAAARLRCSVLKVAVEARVLDPLDALDQLLVAVCEAGVPWSDVAAHVNAAGQVLCGPPRRVS